MAEKITIEYLQQLFTDSYNANEKSRRELRKVEKYYHNESYTARQLQIIRDKGLPPDALNIIKVYARLLVGYYSNLTNTIKVVPERESDVNSAEILHELVQKILKDSNFTFKSDLIKQDMLFSGLLVAQLTTKTTNEFDELNVPIKRIGIEYVPVREIVLDYSSVKSDYSDAGYIHRFKYLTRINLIKFLIKEAGYTLKEATNRVKNIQSGTNFLGGTNLQSFQANFYRNYSILSEDRDIFLLVESVIEFEDLKVYSVFWCDDIILYKKEITDIGVKFPYIVHRLMETNNIDSQPEYYGVFREILPIQSSINQAIQTLLANQHTETFHVQPEAVEDINNFARAIDRKDKVVAVKDFTKMVRYDRTQDTASQVGIITDSINRAEQMLGINKAFMGLSLASESGVKMQYKKQSTVLALKPTENRINAFYTNIGIALVNLIKKHYKAHERFNCVSSGNEKLWLHLNKPIEKLVQVQNPVTGAIEEIRQPQLAIIYENDGKTPKRTKTGAIEIEPILDPLTTLTNNNLQIDIDTANYDDTDDTERQRLYDLLNTPIWQSLIAVEPALTAEAASKIMKGTKSKFSSEISELFVKASKNIERKQAISEKKQTLNDKIEYVQLQGYLQQLTNPQQVNNNNNNNGNNNSNGNNNINTINNSNSNNNSNSGK